MMILVTGGSGSGKSSYAEKRITELCENRMPVYYLATMQVYGEEGRKKVERHRQLRKGKGFLTIEKQRDIDRLLDIDFLPDSGLQPDCDFLPDSGLLPEQSRECGALLECMSNLTANEMFTEDGIRSREETADKIIREMENLKRKLTHLVVVTNNVFEDGVEYDPSTMAYLAALGEINRELAAMADQVWELVAGIPVRLK